MHNKSLLFIQIIFDYNKLQFLKHLFKALGLYNLSESAEV